MVRFPEKLNLARGPVSSPKEPFVLCLLGARRGHVRSPQQTRPWPACSVRLAQPGIWGPSLQRVPAEGSPQKAVRGLARVRGAGVSGRRGVSGGPRRSAPGRGRFLDTLPSASVDFAPLGVGTHRTPKLPPSESGSSAPHPVWLHALLSSISTAVLGMRPHGACCPGARRRQGAGLVWGGLSSPARVSTPLQGPQPLEPGTGSLTRCLPSLLPLPQSLSPGPETPVTRSHHL